MPPRVKFYCGLKEILPPGYQRFGVPYECMKKGFGACLYAGRLGEKRSLFRGINRWLLVIIGILVVVALLGWIGILIMAKKKNNKKV